MCYQNYNGCGRTYGFCEFLRDLFTPVNTCCCGYGNGTLTQENVVNGNGGHGCYYHHRACERRCPCCGYVYANAVNTNGCVANTVQTTTNQTGFGCCRRRRCNLYGYTQYDY